MSLLEHIPSNKRSLDASNVSSILWIFGLGFAGTTCLLVLLQRLGLPMGYVVGFAAVATVVSSVVLCWVGRTMTSSLFFFANKSAGAPHLGIGGLTDWIGGAFLVVFFTIPLTGKMLLSTSLVLGLILFAALFANAFWRSGVLTIPGFLAWRSGSKLANHVSLVVVVGILGCLIFSEFHIARDMLATLGHMEPQTATWLVLIFALLPSLCGGWFALLLANATLAVWMLFSVLLPAIVTGFFPKLLVGNLQLDTDSGTLPALAFESVHPSNPLLMETNFLTASAPGLFLTIAVLAAGFSVLPHALSRIALNVRAVDALESVAWTGLCIFLAISALPLSIGLIGASPSSSTLSVLLESQPVLHSLPYFALLFAAMNALAVVLFALSSALVRGFRRSRNMDPGEQSIFSTRLVGLLIGLAILNSPLELVPPPDQLMIWALVLGAGSLFVPMAAGAWMSNLPKHTLSLSIFCGALTTTIFLSGKATNLSDNLIVAGSWGMIMGAAVILLARLHSALRKDAFPDELKNQLRDPELNS